MKILVLTTLYPLNGIDKKGNQTRIIHNHVKEWVKMGHDVRVIHNDSLNLKPKRIYWEDYGWVKNKKHEYEYEIDGVKILLNPIHMNPIFRYFPFFSHFSIIGVLLPRLKIERYLEKEKFQPQIILVHFCTTQHPLLRKLLIKYSWKPTYVFHNTDLVLVSPRVIKKMISESLNVGVMSEKIQIKLSKMCKSNVKTFQVRAGFPDNTLKNNDSIRIRDRKREIRILYAGRLIPLKNVDVTLKSLAYLKDKYSFTFDIIGDGQCRQDLEDLVSSLGLSNMVKFHGYQSRDFVLELMKSTDCFIMVSSPETLGMVYIEALATGCFVIGSSGEGIEGTIINGENGLLVPPRDVDKLTSALTYYFDLDEREEKRILTNARNMIEEYTETKVAIKCLNDILTK